MLGPEPPGKEFKSNNHFHLAIYDYFISASWPGSGNLFTSPEDKWEQLSDSFTPPSCDSFIAKKYSNETAGSLRRRIHSGPDFRYPFVYFSTPSEWTGGSFFSCSAPGFPPMTSVSVGGCSCRQPSPTGVLESIITSRNDQVHCLMDLWIMDRLQGNHHSNSRRLTASFFFLPPVGWVGRCTRSC